MGWYWTAEEEQILKDNFGRISCAEIAEMLGRTEQAVVSHAGKRKYKGPRNPQKGAERLGTDWSEEELDYLDANWGNVSIKVIAHNLHRSINAVERKRIDLGYPSARESSEYISRADLYRAVSGGHTSTGGIWWINNVPTRRITLKNTTHRMICLDDFWKFAEKNKDRINFSRMEPLALGVEPAWLDKKRRDDYYRTTRVPSFWTSEKLQRLQSMYEAGMAIDEAARELGTTWQAVSVKCRRLRLDMPSTHSPLCRRRYTEEELATIRRMILNGDSLNDIACAINRSVPGLTKYCQKTWHASSTKKLREVFKRDRGKDP